MWPCCHYRANKSASESQQYDIAVTEVLIRQCQQGDTQVSIGRHSGVNLTAKL